MARGDQDLLTQMAAKLSKVEKVSEAQRKEIKEKALKIADLERKLQRFESAAAPEAYQTIEELQVASTSRLKTRRSKEKRRT